ncbi:LysR substrate-binding domain-containing protein [Candidatus Njordibacter sp. Uisw_056]|uniref:LysR substrate-binding domain-containing protein n=1 Tax=Candidatus Njordibacter sp. Uisw_056 TaxID=3230973 RepID=UPI003D4A11B7|tara:strand:+ start:393 stop:1289 length:897 start_codon:yes stop_codon:yes gene_type:complete
MLLKKFMPSAQSLLIFEVAARHLNFTAAAKELGSTQSAVSQQIRGLEQQLELQLFKRIYRGVVLTDTGEQLYEAVESGFGQMTSCLERLQKTRSRQCINVATDFAFAAFWLLPRLPRFRELHPEVEVRIVTSQDQLDFTAQDTDISIVFAKGKPSNYRSHLLSIGTVFPVCSPSLLAQYGPIESHKKLATLPLLKLGDDGGHGWLNWRGFFNQRRSQVIPSEPVLTFNNYTLLVQAAIAGQGVGIGWGALVGDLVESGMLTALSAFSLTSDWDYYLVEANAQDMLPAKRHFVDWLLTE